MANYREILTKAIIAKGNSKIEEVRTMTVEEEISRALGCWIINHRSEVSVEEEAVYIQGSYEMVIWFGFDNDKNCKLAREIFTFKDKIPYQSSDQNEVVVSEKNEIKKYVNKQPTCTELKFDNHTLTTKVIRVYSIDIVGETKLTIKVSEDENKDGLDSINPNYIVEKK